MRAAATAEPPFETPKEPQARVRKIKAAMVWLRAELVAGPRPAAELEHLARAAGIPHTTLQHAKKRLSAHSARKGNRYFWYLPTHKQQAIASGEKGHTS